MSEFMQENDQAEDELVMDANVLSKPPVLEPGFEAVTDEVKEDEINEENKTVEGEQEEEKKPTSGSTPTAQKLKSKGKSAKKSTGGKMTAAEIREIQTSIAEK
jgi:hypothetical protein